VTQSHYEMVKELSEAKGTAARDDIRSAIFVAWIFLDDLIITGIAQMERLIHESLNVLVGRLVHLNHATALCP